jgi:hypothetical protein
MRLVITWLVLPFASHGLLFGRRSRGSGGGFFFLRYTALPLPSLEAGAGIGWRLLRSDRARVAAARAPTTRRAPSPVDSDVSGHVPRTEGNSIQYSSVLIFLVVG